MEIGGRNESKSVSEERWVEKEGVLKGGRPEETGGEKGENGKEESKPKRVGRESVE